MANFFPRWTNLLPVKIVLCLGVLGAGMVVGFTYYATPKALRVGYQPSQPIPYSHDLHVRQLGMDCRYCHSYVEYSAHANVPAASVCWKCHSQVAKGSPALAGLRAAMGVDEDHQPLEGEAAKGLPIEWVRVHKSPDYVYFNHSAHLNRGISCRSCHGKVNEMVVVRQAESHAMGFCLDCHRNPEAHLRPLEEVFNLDYEAEEYLAGNEVYDTGGKRITTQEEFGKFLKEHWSIAPRESCAACHR